MINIQLFQRNNIYFLARIDQQAEIYHSSLSKQDSTNKNKNKKTTKKQQQQKNCVLNLVFHDRAFK